MKSKEDIEVLTLQEVEKLVQQKKEAKEAKVGLKKGQWEGSDMMRKVVSVRVAKSAGRDIEMKERMDRNVGLLTAVESKLEKRKEQQTQMDNSRPSEEETGKGFQVSLQSLRNLGDMDGRKKIYAKVKSRCYPASDEKEKQKAADKKEQLEFADYKVSSRSANVCLFVSLCLLMCLP